MGANPPPCKSYQVCVGVRNQKIKSQNKSEEVDHTKKKKKEEDNKMSSLFTMMNNVSTSTSEARAIYGTLTSLSIMNYHILVYHVYVVTWGGKPLANSIVKSTHVYGNCSHQSYLRDT